ncbi:MAG: hypothetical protein ACLRNW_08935 [Neglectibacter sp.]
MGNHEDPAEGETFETTPVNTNATYNGDMLFCKPAHVMIEKCRLVQEAGVIPQITFYSSADVDHANRYLIRSGLLEKPYNFFCYMVCPDAVQWMIPSQ